MSINTPKLLHHFLTKSSHKIIFIQFISFGLLSFHFIVFNFFAFGLQAQNKPTRCIHYKHTVSFEHCMKHKIAERKSQRTTAEVVTIPVVVHVIHNGEPVGEGTNISQLQIESQIRILNEDFRRKINTNGYNTHPAGADIEINFQLAIQSPTGLPTNGVVRVKGTQASWGILDEPTMKALSYWNSENYLNIWVANLNGVLGYAQFPETSLIGIDQNPSTQNPLTDGVVVNYTAFGDMGTAQAPFDKGRTATHEVGHYLGLLHISGDGACPTDDFCTDTPPVNDQTDGCPSPIPVACDGTLAQIENYMDYTDDRCMNLFTQEQKDRMRTVLANSPRRKTLKDSPGLQPVTLTPDNVNIVSITQVQNSTCETEVIPRVLIQNIGNNALTSLVITYDIDGIAPQSVNWQGNLASLDTTTVALPTSETTRNAHVLNVQLLRPNGQTDTDQTNNSKSSSFTVKPIASLPLEYDFSDITILENEWEIVNPDNNETWQPIIVSSQSLGNVTGNSTLQLPYFDYNRKGEEDQLITPLLDVSAIPQLTLQFDVAYAPFQDGNAIIEDGLKVGVSTDCGKTFTTVYEKFGEELATDDPVLDSWKPVRENQWRTETISLNDWAGKGNIQVGFIGVNGFGNNIYLDEVKLIASSLSNNPADFVVVFPNPVSDKQINFSLRLPQVTDQLEWVLYDLTGRQINAGQVTSAQFQLVTIPEQVRLTGVYILKVSTDQYTITKRIVVL